MPRVYEPLVLEIEPPYIGSAVSPTVDITETSEDVTVTITDSRGEHSYTVDKTDQAIADAEAAAANANAAASTATAKGQQAVDIANTAAANADAKAALAESAASTATTAAGNADDAARDARAAMADTQAATQAANAATSNAQAATSTANTAAQNADAKAALANTAAANADAKATLADNAATSATTAAAQASTSAANADTSATAANIAAAAADAAREAIQDDLANKADIDGYYPLLGAGASDALMSADATVDTFAQRVSNHDGGVRIESLRGRTVRFNQLSYKVWPRVQNVQGLTITVNSTNSMDIHGTVGADFTSSRFAISENIILKRDGRKYLFKTNKDVGHNLTLNGYSQFNGRNGFIWSATASSDWMGGVQVTAVPGDVFDVSDVKGMIFDLTTMFGPGNEPSTVEEFDRMYSEDYYPYDAGSLLSVNVEGIESAGVIREIPAATYFPEGMRSVGSVYDELTSDKAFTRIGSVDLGSLNWIYDASNNYFATTGITSRKPGFNALKCVKYETASSPATTTLPNNQIVGGVGSITVYIRDSNYTDAATFKAAMDGVILYYELAAPTETAIEPPLNLTYQTEQGGTESIVIPTGGMSAAPTMVVVYAYNADGVRDLSQAIIATIEGNTASTNYAIGGYFVHGGELYRATSAIAAGETINPGTNCTQTTVMAELLALTA